MANRGKSQPGKTRKYSGLANKVRSSSSKPPVQAPLSRIGVDRIKKIYDEYGFNQPNAQHVQTALPNDEQKLRKILDVHRKVLDEEVKSRAKKKVDDMKYHASVHQQNQKNHLDAMKAAAKYAKDTQRYAKDMSSGGATGGPGMPMGGPPMAPGQPLPVGQPISDQSQPAEMNQVPGFNQNQTPLDLSNTGEAFFVGEFALLKLVNPGVQSDKSPIWLADVNSKVLRPFMSQKAFDSYFGQSQAAYDAIVTLPTSALSEGGPLAEFKMMNSDYGVKDDGSMRKLNYSPATIQKRYGKPVDEAGENKAVLALDGLFRKIKEAGRPQAAQPQMGGQMPPEGQMPAMGPVNPMQQ